MRGRAHAMSMRPMIEFSTPDRSALDELRHLRSLRIERALALTTPLAHQRAYLADIDAEIDATSDAFVGLAVTEIATLHGELGGRSQG
jgi:hypothetical protein